MPERAARELVARPVRLRHPAPFPSAFQHLQVALPAAVGVDAHAVAVDLADEVDPALIDAAVRRHWWSTDHGQLTVRRARACELCAEGDPVLRPDQLGWTDPAEREVPGFPLARDDDQAPRLWVRARRDDATGGARAWVPYTMAVARPFDTRPDEPLAHPPLLGGFGAGVDPEHARAAAWRSIVVDDALWCWWTGSARAAPLDVDAEVRTLWRDAELGLTLRRLDQGVFAPVTVAAVDDGTAVTIGGGFGVDAPAQRAAIARALWQLAVARELHDPDGRLHGLAVPGVVGHRTDRRYAPRTEHERRRLLDPLAHVQLALDPRVRGAVLRRLADTGVQPTSTVGIPLTETWTVDIAPDGSVVRVLSPGTVPLALGAFRLDPVLLAAAARRPGALTPSRRAGCEPYPGW